MSEIKNVRHVEHEDAFKEVVSNVTAKAVHN
jgi:hypothetical protein